MAERARWASRMASVDFARASAFFWASDADERKGRDGPDVPVGGLEMGDQSV